MDYSQFIYLVPELSLLAVMLVVFLMDFFSHGREERRWFNPAVCVLMLAHLLFTFNPGAENVSAFGGMYESTPAAGTMKTILGLGTLLVLLLSRGWLLQPAARRIEGEFYVLCVSTLLGMYMMMSAGNFLLFFIGLETATVPLACMVALDKYRAGSAEAAAKFILTATFSSGVMLYGISFLYGAVGTLYFSDVALVLTATPMPLMGMVFFVAGLGFKISLVPFHFWTADTYQGAPTTVTAYLSVISKGAAAFTLAVLLYKVFAALMGYWLLVLYVLIVLSITVANLMAIRQTELKRFMAFSSISQAGYIVLATIGGDPVMSQTALMYYVLVYIVANLAVFTLIASVERATGGRTEISAYNGLYRTNPKAALMMTLALFSLAGIPPFAGMFSKFFVFLAALEGRETFVPYLVVFIALLNTVVSLYYYLLIVKAMYIRAEGEPVAPFRIDPSSRLILAVCMLGILFFGIASEVYEFLYAAN